MKPALRIVATGLIMLIIIILALLFTGCIPPWRIPSYGPHRYVNSSDHKYDSCIVITAMLNDTLFYRDSIIEKMKMASTNYFEGELFEIFPTAKALFKNKCNCDLLVPYYNLCGGPVTRVFNAHNNGPTIAYTVGRPGSVIDPSQNVDPNYVLVDKECGFISTKQMAGSDIYKELTANKEIMCEYNLSPFNEFYSRIIPDTGLYWMQVALRNYLVEDTNIPIWTGVVWSDTVWFMVK